MEEGWLAVLVQLGRDRDRSLAAIIRRVPVSTPSQQQFDDLHRPTGRYGAVQGRPADGASATCFTRRIYLNPGGQQQPGDFKPALGWFAVERRVEGAHAAGVRGIEIDFGIHQDPDDFRLPPRRRGNQRMIQFFPIGIRAGSQSAFTKSTSPFSAALSNSRQVPSPEYGPARVSMPPPECAI